MKLKGFLFNTLAIVLILSFILIDLLLIGMIRFDSKEEEQKICVSIQDSSIDNDVILQGNSEV